MPKIILYTDVQTSEQKYETGITYNVNAKELDKIVMFKDDDAMQVEGLPLITNKSTLINDYAEIAPLYIRNKICKHVKDKLIQENKLLKDSKLLKEKKLLRKEKLRKKAEELLKKEKPLEKEKLLKKEKPLEK